MVSLRHSATERRSTLAGWSPTLRYGLWMAEVARLPLISFVALMLLCGVLPSISVWASMHVFSSAVLIATEHSDPRGLLLWIVSWGGISLVSSLLFSFYQLSREVLQNALEDHFQTDLQNKVSRLPLDSFERSDYHAMLRRAEAAIEPGVMMNLLSETWSIGQASVLVVSVSVLLVRWDSWMLIPILVIGLVDATVQYRHAKIANDLRLDLTDNERERDYLEALLTTSTAAKEVRILRVGRRIIKRWGERQRFASQSEWALERQSNSIRGLLAVLGTCALIAGVVVAAWQTVDGRLAVGAFAASLYGLQQLQMGFNETLGRVKYYRGYLFRIVDFFNYLDIYPESENGECSCAEIGGIEARNVSYSYPQSNRPSLDNVSFVLRRGERIALVGENGAGKSTLVRLLLGMYTPSTGEVLYNGCNVASLEGREKLDKTAAVFQDFTRFSLAMRDNIGFGRHERLRDRSAVERAAEKGGVSEFIHSLPEGYDTELTTMFSGGMELSGGQWQRVAIARAFMREAELVVLDEPTAALDPQAEREILERFLDLAADRTSLIVSHRLGVARLCDRIIVLQNGRVCEIGNHDELVMKGGEYARMWALQSQWYA